MGTPNDVTTFATFKSGAAFSTLQKNIADCLDAENPTADCDAVIGSAAAGAGFCADPANAATSYCACVNSAYPCPHTAAAACANNPRAYKPTSMVGPSGKEYLTCVGRAICLNSITNSGVDGRLDDVTQECDGTVAVDYLKTHPLVVVVAILLLVLIALGIAAGLVSDDPDEPDTPATPAAPAAPDTPAAD